MSKILTPETYEKIISFDNGEEETRSYTPVNHEELITLIKGEFKAEKIRINSEYYIVNNSGTQMVGFLTVNILEDQKAVVAFRNAMDKIFPISIVSGLMNENKTFLLTGEPSMVKKSSKDVFGLVTSSASEIVKNIGNEFEMAMDVLNYMRNTKITKAKAEQIFGNLMLEHQQDINRNTIIESVKTFGKINKKHDRFSLFQLYECFHGSLINSQPQRTIEQFIALRSYLENVSQ